MTKLGVNYCNVYLLASLGSLGHSKQNGEGIKTPRAVELLNKPTCSLFFSGYGRPRNSSNLDLDCGSPDSPSSGICFDPCQNHTVLNDPTRSTENNDSSVAWCDDNLHGWYRFVGDGGVKMPETCVSVFRCHTSAPMWLSGSHPILGDGIVSHTACANWNENCCFWRSEVQVKACSEELGEYHVYKLQGTPECSLRYCTGKQQLQGRVNFSSKDSMEPEETVRRRLNKAATTGLLTGIHMEM